MLEVVVDTNVIMDALFPPYDSECQLLLDREADGLYSFVMSDAMFAELRDVGERLEKAHHVKPWKIARNKNRLMAMAFHTRRLNPQKEVYYSPDPSDNEFIAVAIEAPVQYLVTSNKKHFQNIPVAVLNSVGERITFVTPKAFNSITREILRVSRM